MLNWLSSYYKTKKIMFRDIIRAFVCNFNIRQAVFPQWAIRFEDIHRNVEALESGKRASRSNFYLN
jgi:hypothetical protein